MKDFYHILGVDNDCTFEQIKEAYTILSKKFNPGLNPAAKYFEGHFEEIAEAYETLGNPYKRIEYDQQLQKFKSDPRADFSQNLSEQAAREYGSSNSAFKSKIKGPGIGMTITLIVVFIILGVYIAQYFSKPKPHNTNKELVENTDTVKLTRHHKKKHHLKSKNTPDSLRVAKRINPTPTVQPAAISKKQPPMDNVQAAPVNNPYHTGAFLYTTYVRSNVTGIINMRKLDDYSSEVIKTIPAYSEVSVIEKGRTYYKVSFDNAIGYVPKWAIGVK